jgi:site-specific DNA recombinase
MNVMRVTTIAKEKLGTQMDRLDYSDRHYKDKMTDMQRRLDLLYDDIAEANASLEEITLRITNIKEQRMTGQKVYDFLELFDIMYDKFTDAEKKKFLQSFVKKVKIYPEPMENGQILKSIQFRFPVFFQGNKAGTFFSELKNNS